MSRPYDVVFRAPRAITPDGEAGRCVGVRGGVIAAVEPWDSGLEAERVVELGDDEVLLPGLVDSHVHVNEPGRTEWEGFATATRAAAAGGITSIVDMPLNSIPPTVTVDAFEVKRTSAHSQCFVDVGFWGGAVPGNLGELRELHAAGVLGFKCFLLHSGVEEFAPLGAAQVEQAMREVSSFDGLLIVHAEDADTIAGAPTAQGRDYRDFLRSRPRAAENVAIARMIDLAQRTGCRVHILHLSSSDALAAIASARDAGVPVSVETCSHYLALAAEDVPEGATEFKCCPPIRESANRELLWQGLAAGLIDCVVSDHSPCPPELKLLDAGDFGGAWGGISSLQLGLPVVWTEARRRGFDLTDVAGWMAAGPARQAGLARKGRVEVGCDADLCVFAPGETFEVDPARLHHRHAVTPYTGRTLTGAVRATWLAGREIDLDAGPRGRLLTRGEP